jgi:hypothetical protein
MTRQVDRRLSPLGNGDSISHALKDIFAVHLIFPG